MWHFRSIYISLICLHVTLLHVNAEVLHLTTSSNPSRINPLLATDSGSSDIANHVFNALVKYDKDAKEIIGDLAASYYFENNTTLVFKLRDDVLWHDGVRFSAKDVKFTFDLINDESVVSPYTSTFRKVKSVEIIDDLTLRVHYSEPYFKAVETWMMGIVPYHLLKDEKNIMNAAFNTHPIGTGPYRLTKLEFSKSIELSANSTYFEKVPGIEKIIYHVVSDVNTRFLMLKSKKIDIDGLNAMQYERQLSDDFTKAFQIIEAPAHSYDYLGFNLRLKKFSDARVREALSLVIDRKMLADILFLSHATVCTGPFLPGSRSFDSSVKTPTRDIERAKKLLAQAGYSKEHPLRFEIATSNGSNTRVYAAEIIQQQLLEVGVEVRLRIMEWQAFLNMVVFPREFESVLLGWSLSLSPDPYLLWHSDSDRAGGFNFIGYHNDSVDSLIEKMQSTTDSDALAAIQRSIFREIVADNPYLFLYIPNAITAVNAKIEHVVPSINGIWHNYIHWQMAQE